MKNDYLIRMRKLFLVILIFSIVQVSKAQSDVADKEAVQMLRTFYTGYMTAIASSVLADVDKNEKKCETLKEKYCTQRLLKNIPKLAEKFDSDPLINAQDSRMDCVKNLTFNKNLKKPNSYTVSYYYIDEFSKKKEIFNINVTLVKQNGNYKMDEIW